MPGRRTPNRRFFRPPSPPFQPRDFRLPPRELLARELAPDTVVAARPTGGHFGSQIRESVQERQHVLLRHGEKVGVLAFCHGLLKFEPQNARLRTAKVTGAVLGQESGSARKEFCQEGFLSGRNFVRKGFCQERFLSGRNFVRKGFCQEAGSARKGESALELGVKLFVVVVVAVVLSVFVLGRAGGQSALELGVKLFVVAVVAVVLSVFVLGRAGGQSALELGVKLFAVAVAVVVARRRALFLFWGGRGPVSFRAVKGECFESALELGVKLFAVAVAVCFCFGAGGGPVSFRGCEGGRGASQLWSWV